MSCALLHDMATIASYAYGVLLVAGGAIGGSKVGAISVHAHTASACERAPARQRLRVTEGA